MPSQNKQPTDYKQIVHHFMEHCWNQGKLNMVSDYIADQCRFHDPVFPGLTSGAQNLRTHIENCRRAFPDLKFSIDDTIAERNEVVIHWTGRGTHKGDFLGMSPTNRKVNVSGTSIYRLDGSRVAEAWTNWNLMSMMEQLGVSPAAHATQPQATQPHATPTRHNSKTEPRAGHGAHA
jgi:steroid delta-isomerase-like uncharacterized protein